MNSKIKGAFVLFAAAAALSFSAAPGNPAAGAVAHPSTPALAFTGFTGDRLCDLEGSALCMSGDDGVNELVTGTTGGTNNELHVNEFVTSDCNNGKVSDRSGSGPSAQGAPCPFADGSGLNHHFDNASIVQLFNTATVTNDTNLRYAASGSHNEVIEEGVAGREIQLALPRFRAVRRSQPRVSLR
jgi:hypothetical protein